MDLPPRTWGGSLERGLPLPLLRLPCAIPSFSSAPASPTRSSARIAITVWSVPRWRGCSTFDTRLAGRLDVQRIEFERPRPALVALLGTEHQNCPTRVLAQPPEPGAPGVQTSNSTGRAFVTGLVPIGEYLAFAHGVARPHP